MKNPNKQIATNAKSTVTEKQQTELLKHTGQSDEHPDYLLPAIATTDQFSELSILGLWNAVAPTEKAIRREHVRQANFCVDLEGFEISPEQAADFERYILGELSLEQVIANTKARAGLKTSTPATNESAFTRVRILELRIKPVIGEFDATHLREINRRILQDMPMYSGGQLSYQYGRTCA
ncbi:MAG: hypothetical protein HOP06_06505 [Methylotenera sp.]|nr:hypothetical protein [Methylotenera sp.]